MKIYCICLPKRKEYIKKFFRILGIEPVYTPITTIDDLQRIGLDSLLQYGVIDINYYKKLRNIDDPKKLRVWYGKIACSMSHATAMKQLLKDGGDKALIFEDDNHIPEKNEVSIIHKRLKNILVELDQTGEWLFCNLSPCISDSDLRVSNNLYTGTLGYCMNAYLVTPLGVQILLNTFPLGEKEHTLDNYLLIVGKKYPKQMFDVHPRLFSQKTGHTFESELGNNHDDVTVVNEYINEQTTIKKVRKYLYIPVIIMVVMFVISLVSRIKWFIIISSIILLISILVLYLYYEREEYDLYKKKVRDINTLIHYTSLDYDLFNGKKEYRLGDVFFGYGNIENHIEYMIKNFPNSIAVEYIHSGAKSGDYETLATIVARRSKDFSSLREDEAVIHLRCGDVIDKLPQKVSEMLKKEVKNPFNGVYYIPTLSYYIDEFEKLVQKGIKKITIIAGSHFELPNYKKSCEYIMSIKILAEKYYGLSVELKLGGDPDEDVIYMVNAQHFVPSRGWYSKMINTLRNYRNDWKYELVKSGGTPGKTINVAIQHENLLILKTFFEKHNIKYFLDCGTLLGIIRENKLIEYDLDSDISVDKKDINIIRKNLSELRELGFKEWRNRDEGYIAMSLTRKGEYIDIYQCFEINFLLVQYPFLNKTFPVPEYPEEWLQEIYGPNWKTPTEDKSSYDISAWENGMKKYIQKYKIR